jgi:hypothetical protein
MTNYFVGAGGLDANAGTSYALRRLTIASAEGLLAAGDTLLIAPGTYRESITLGVSGTAGNPITWRGDFLGTSTDGVGGVIRITGSDDDKVAARANCVTATTRSYRTFQNIQFDTSTSTMVNSGSAGSNWTLQRCLFNTEINGASQLGLAGAAGNHLIDSCLFYGCNNIFLTINNGSTFDNSGDVIQNCIFMFGNGRMINSDRVGGITVKNCALVGTTSNAVRVGVALSAGQSITVNNCLIVATAGLTGITLGDLVEDYNNFFANSTARTNVNTGANSQAYPGYIDPRWFFNLLLAGAGPNSMGQVLSPFDMASFSQLVNLAGTSPSTTDMRGTAVQGAQREWGALEYDSTLKYTGGIHKGRIRISE